MKEDSLQAKIYDYFSQKNDAELLLVSDDKGARSAHDVLAYLGYTPYLLPDFRAGFGDDLRAYKEELQKLLTQLAAYYQNPKSKKILVSPFRTLTHPMPKPELFRERSFAFGDRIDLEALKESLLFWGYSFVDIVEERGEVSFRGDIIDIFPPRSETAYRISLFDDEIESIRTFACETQKSKKEELESFSVTPAFFALDEEAYTQLTRRIEALESDAFIKDVASVGFWVLDDLAEDFLSTRRIVKLSAMTQEIEEHFSFAPDDTKRDLLQSFEIVPEPQHAKDIEVADLASLLTYHRNKKITLIANNEAIVKQHAIPDEITPKICYAEWIVNILTDKELILSLNRQERRKRRKRSAIVLDDLKTGDYVVHEQYGIGIFKGLTNTRVLGVTRDFVEIQYQGEDKLLLPVENLDMIDRYISEGGSLAVLDRLGKGSFGKLKAKAKAKLFEIAREIIEIAAQRELVEAPVIRSDDPSLLLFQNDAGFLYTEDQSKAITEIFKAMESGRVMDMLLSGDVGFGKTEVAMNAIFACVKSGYQAAFIAPTTLLSTQHYKSLQERFERYGISVAKINRFTTAKEKSAIVKGLKEGSIDVCVGTHALFGVAFANLGLVVLDEEHKFGVKQKEKLKQFKESVHVLSMSATPIPRSLNMALSSIKAYAQLLTPPLEREDVRTFVKSYDDALIKEVVLREQRRGGQVFYIHNRIASIESKKRALQEMMPDLKILVLHSKIPPAKTEKEMLDFEAGKYDLLLSTSIVESGIHMPNVNTMIVESADSFGIADLHQLRGRVGRGNRQGYCYFLVEDKEQLREDARKRLIALESNSFLGSGSVLAYHDLEIRGGGNLVGEAQSGHIKNIGYSLYLKMLEDTLGLLLNQQKEEKREVEIKLNVSAYLSSEVVGEDRIRLELYRRLSRCETPKEVYEIEEEMIDRFGKLDTMTKQFLEIIVIKIRAAACGIERISSYEQNITIEYPESKEYLKAPSKDDDDILTTTAAYLKERERAL